MFKRLHIFCVVACIYLACLCTARDDRSRIYSRRQHHTRTLCEYTRRVRNLLGWSDFWKREKAATICRLWAPFARFQNAFRCRSVRGLFVLMLWWCGIWWHFKHIRNQPPITQRHLIARNAPRQHLLRALCVRARCDVGRPFVLITLMVFNGMARIDGVWRAIWEKRFAETNIQLGVGVAHVFVLKPREYLFELKNKQFGFNMYSWWNRTIHLAICN